MLAKFLANRRRTSEQRPLLERDRPPAREDSGSSENDGFYEGGSDSDGYGAAPREHDEDTPYAPLLPIFSAPHLDRIPVYHFQHSIRILVLQKCETTLSFDQLRSPQISQFIVKPLQQQIRASHMSRGTLYALLANCLQFQKDAQMNPGMVGVFKTRAMLCELLAMRLLKESSTRELIDALFYDFDPLQGVSPVATGTATPRIRTKMRISTVEIAIRAQAKRFLAHPLVVQQLEAIWAGTIVFHSVADTLHRRPSQQGALHSTQYGAVDPQPSKRNQKRPRNRASPMQAAQDVFGPETRRSVSLYDPSDASLFKLSRLRVPRYRQLFSTLSYAIMLGLFLAVLVERSLDITALELVFWFWSAGYMLDELVGFNEQGFGLYIMSVWNAFDIGILILFVAHYVLRLYGILMPDVRKRHMANMAYDVLASTAILLFPRLFSVLDHYRYFSQLLIAFRMMAVDLAAILILIVISCSGFFVAFTLSFSDKDFNAASAAYALFQIVMGFTPAAWEMWLDVNLLGKSILVVFLIICHFLIVTILITVLTNSFMAIVQNANEEHQFLFAVNTISMVKSDALFSYIAPTNVLGWLLAPLRHVMSFRQFVRMNRTIIKVTHLPILFSICIYERIFLARNHYEPTDLVEQRGRAPKRLPAFSIRGPADLFSPGARLREPSVTTFHKDRALEEVFRRPFKGSTIDRERGRDDSTMHRTKTTNVVHDWMQGVGQQGAASPMEQPREDLDKLETRRPLLRRYKTSGATPGRRDSSTMAPRSDPEESCLAVPRQYRTIREEEDDLMSFDDIPQQTDRDGDDELATNDEDDEQHTLNRSFNEISEQDDSDKENHRDEDVPDEDEEEHYFRTPTTAKARTPMFHTAATHRMKTPDDSPTRPGPIQAKRQAMHKRNASTATILYSPMLKPLTDTTQETPSLRSISPAKSKNKSPPKNAPLAERSSAGTRTSGTATPRRSGGAAGKRPHPFAALTNSNSAHSRPRPILPSKHAMRSTPNLTTFLALDRRKPSFNAMALDLASDLGDNRVVPDSGIVGGMPASFGTHVEFGGGQIGGRRRFREDSGGGGGGGGGGDTTRRLSKLVLSRMSTLEEGFKEVLREVKGLSRGGIGSASGSLGTLEERGVGMGNYDTIRRRSGFEYMHGYGGGSGKERVVDGEGAPERGGLGKVSFEVRSSV
ncbi:hypothetical protein EJ08DRAFT_595708 [Tothia fuscella]|uniref:Ion transport domain-containing protein n=1 Tax=Tothia fuscella TaxID=1048955 RepID=A0A9P4NJK1_9PEZI|nr:hypothetical protein EJ08DRAFT_595708 [Tothia fuscella]